VTFRREDAVIAGGAAVLFLAAFLVYWPALHGEFIWDDTLNISTNPTIRSDDGLIDIWAAGPQVFDYYPVTWTSWWIEWRLWKRDTLGYHVVNVLLHAGAAAVLWRLLARLRVPGAFVAALIFALHPVNVETVAWITERKNTLSMFLAAVATTFYLDSADPDGTRRSRRALYAGALVAFTLALLAKPAAVTLPVVLLAVAWWQRGRVDRADLLRAAPLLAVSAIVSVITVVVHHARGIADAPVRTDGFIERLMTAGWAVWFYLYKLLWPAKLAFFYPRWQVDRSRPVHWLPLATLLVALVGLFLLRRRIGRGGFVALASFVVLLLPVLGFVNVYFMRYSFVSDHWQYQAGFVVIAAAVAGCCYTLRRFGGSRVTVVVGGPVVTGVVCVALATRSWHEAQVYRSPLDLWAKAVHDNPSSGAAWNNYGAELNNRGRKAEAVECFLRGIEVEPGWNEPYLSMGAVQQAKDPAAAIPWFERAIGKPGCAGDPRALLAGALLALGRADEALTWFDRALADSPVSPGYRRVAAGLHLQRGDTAKAIQLYEAETHDWPRDPDAWFLLAGARATAGQMPEARAALAEACRRAKSDHAMIRGFGSRLLASLQPELAADAFRASSELQPDYGPAYVGLGYSLELLGRTQEAKAAYHAALRVQPGSRDAREGLARLESPKGAFPGPSSTMPAR
jgi:tetratricopeptide (TPR) repeat protein